MSSLPADLLRINKEMANFPAGMQFYYDDSYPMECTSCHRIARYLIKYTDHKLMYLNCKKCLDISIRRERFDSLAYVQHYIGYDEFFHPGVIFGESEDNLS